MHQARHLILNALLLCTAISLPGFAQTTAARAGAIDLSVRLKDAQNDPKLADALFKTGRKVAAVCANCHGEGGNSTKPDIPNLAAQNPAYLLEQLRKFADGSRRFEFMEGMIKALSTDEKVGIVLFYSVQRASAKSAPSPGLAAKGKEYFNKVCFRCHGENGLGSDKFARIAGQQPEYLKVTLKRYRTGTGARVDPLMAANTKLMTDADIDAVVAYVASMP